MILGFLQVARQNSRYGNMYFQIGYNFFTLLNPPKPAMCHKGLIFCEIFKSAQVLRGGGGNYLM